MTAEPLSAVSRSIAVSEGAVSCLVSIAAYLSANVHLVRTYRVAPAIEDLFAACGSRPGWMPDPTALQKMPEWTALLERKLSYFPCDVVRDLPPSEVGITWELQRYFHLTLSNWFRIVGPTPDGFISFQAASYAITCVLAYGIFRLGLGRLVSLACTAGFVWSASHLAVAGLPIEYAKAPWVLAILLLAGLLVKWSAAGRELRWLSLGLGLVAGVGIGFKPDVLALAPLAVAIPILFAGTFRRDGLVRKSMATVIVVAGIAIGGGQMLAANFLAPTGSLLPVQVLGGQDWQTESLHAESPLYDYGISWDDSYVTWMINSYGHRVLGTTVDSGFFSREMEVVATGLQKEMWATFPGDLVTRVLAAVIRVVRLNGASPWVALAGLLLVFGFSPRYGWLAVFVTVYVSAYVSLVFQRRHIFHLEVIAWWFTGVVGQALLSGGIICWQAWRTGQFRARLQSASLLLPRAVGAGLRLAALAAAAWIVLSGARSVQNDRLVDLAGRYAQMPIEARGVEILPRDANDVTVRVAGLSLIDRQAGPETVAADYLVARFQCGVAGSIRVKTRYLPPVVDWANWNREFVLPCAAPGTETTLMAPIYQYGNDYRFDGLVLSRNDADAVKSVATMRADASVRLWLSLFLPADWPSRRWFETLRSPVLMPL